MSDRITHGIVRQDRPCLVVPRRNVQTLCAIEHGRLVDLCPVPSPINAECAISRHGWVAWTDPDDLKPIHLWHCDAEPGRDKFAPLQMPGEQYVKQLVFQGDALWIVGNRAGYLAVCPLGSLARVPVEIANPVAEIAHLTFGGSKPYVTSDDGKQKFLRRLSADTAKPLTVEASTELPRRNLDDCLDVAVGTSWVAVLEWTFSFCEESCHLCLFCPETLAVLEGSERVSVTTNGLFTSDAGLRIKGAPDWKSLAWDGDVLFLASGSRGVGVLDLRGQTLRTPLEHEISYVDVPGEVQRVIPWARFGTVLAVTMTAGRLDTIPLALPEAF